MRLEYETGYRRRSYGPPLRQGFEGQAKKKAFEERCKTSNAIKFKLIKKARHRATLPQGSTIAAGVLNDRVREGNVCFNSAMDTGQKIN